MFDFNGDGLARVGETGARARLRYTAARGWIVQYVETLKDLALRGAVSSAGRAEVVRQVHAGILPSATLACGRSAELGGFQVSVTFPAESAALRLS